MKSHRLQGAAMLPCHLECHGRDGYHRSPNLVLCLWQENDQLIDACTQWRQVLIHAWTFRLRHGVL